MQATRRPLATHALVFSLAASISVVVAAVIRCWLHADACAGLDWPHIALGAAFLAGLTFVAFWLGVAVAQRIRGPSIEARSARTSVYGGVLLGLTLQLLNGAETWLVIVAATPLVGTLLFRRQRTDTPR